MSDERLRSLLRVQLPREHVSAAAERARLAALRSLPATTGGARRGIRWRKLSMAGAMAAVLAVVAVTVTSWAPGSSPQVVMPAAEEHQPLQVHLTLSDGTKVVWTLDDEFSM